MRFTLFISVCCMIAQAAFAKSNYELGGKDLDSYTIVYSSNADPDEGIDRANYLRTKLKKGTKVSNSIKGSADFRQGDVIRIVNPNTIGTFDYSVDVKPGSVTICGGSSWAMNRAMDILVDKLEENMRVPVMQYDGTVEGEVLFVRPAGVNLRIFDDNVWDYSQDTIPTEWAQAGIDCRDAARAPKFAQLIRAYMPDIICLQEYNCHMDAELYPMLKKYGYMRASSGKEESWPHTPIFYDKNVWKQLRVNYRLYGYGPNTWCNNGSKSFCSAVLKNKETGQTVGVVSTHLWFRGDKTHPGSSYARASQAALIMAEAEVIKAKFDCPVFVCGDMNSTENTLAMKLFKEGGYKPCYEIATQYADKELGHHACFDHVAGSRASNGKGRKEGSIDHCLLYNGKGTEVKVFDCLRPYFSVFLTDHYPNLIDAILK